MKFVEAQQPGFVGERRRDGLIGSSFAISPDFISLADGVEPLVHVGHELVEVRAALAPHRARGEEQVHQHGLAAPDVAVDVEAADRAFLALAFSEQPAELRGFARRAGAARAAPPAASSFAATASCAGSRSISPSPTRAA